MEKRLRGGEWDLILDMVGLGLKERKLGALLMAIRKVETRVNSRVLIILGNWTIRLFYAVRAFRVISYINVEHSFSKLFCSCHVHI